MINATSYMEADIILNAMQVQILSWCQLIICIFIHRASGQ